MSTNTLPDTTTPATLPARVTTINAEKFRNACLFRLRIRRYGNRAKIKDGAKLTEYLALKKQQENETPELGSNNGAGPAITGEISGSVTATKRLLVSPALDAVNELLTQTKEKLVGRFGIMAPSNIQPGLFACRVETVAQAEAIIEDAQTKLALELLPAFRADFAPAIERARTARIKDGGLGPLFDASDYITEDEAAEAFGIEHYWLSLDVPENLPAELRAAAAEKLERQFTEAADEVKLALREGFQQLIAHAAEALKPGEDGAKKIFRNSLTDNIAAFCDSFNARNIMNDTELAALVSRAREVLTTIDTGGKATADVIRKNASVRENVQAQFSAIAAELGAQIETERSRQFSFSED